MMPQPDLWARLRSGRMSLPHQSELANYGCLCARVCADEDR